MTAARQRVLVVTLDTIADRMAGPAIRAWEIARALAGPCDVRLVTFGACSRPGVGFGTAQVRVEDFRAEVEGCDVVVLQGFVVRTFPWLADCPQAIVVDLYDPFQLETLEVDRYRPTAVRWEALVRARLELEAQVGRGDLFLCASGRQRDLWIGQLAAAGRINPATYDDDPSLGRLLQVVPFGLAEEPPVRTAPAIKGVVDGIGPDDKVILWGGGVYNWFDPITLVRAVARLHERDPRVRLFFLGMKHPNPDVEEMRVATRTRELADELGLTGSVVFFNESWVAYERRGDYLLDADVGVSCHFPHVETEFSFRTRILDYLWAGLPVVCTRGDAFARLVDDHGAGVTVPPEDVDALADALELALAPGPHAGFRAASAVLADSFRWSSVLAPLVAFCTDPYRAADSAYLASAAGAAGRAGPSGPPVAWHVRLRADLAAAWRHLRSGGPRQVLAKVRWRLARLRAH
ncbi:glycosyltransferase [Actinotalea sp.]|uniref:glycosyltransferase n=1 Tax=Actinotalea sp. TaxID=1872145 RepID=UPI002CEE0FD4|nr:glycosyltransferase [Actinotalea sp.]HRA51678.1 glycosyltransferase [Actinotalea sp.]